MEGDCTSIFKAIHFPEGYLILVPGNRMNLKSGKISFKKSYGLPSAAIKTWCPCICKCLITGTQREA